MGSNKKYYIGIDFIRVLACVAILLYHLNILKGGYLAVCTFFCLSGYLSCISAFRKKKFSLLSYYCNRLLKLYVPLVIVVFLTVFVVSLFPNISWFNLKPETTSVLLGYNNFWQLGANLDYFARHINSPFMHLWYIGILLQFDLIFPFIYMFFRKLGDKIHKSVPIIITILLSSGFFIYFYIMSTSQNLMSVYYNTFTRVFSILFGVTLGFIHSYGKQLIPNILKNRYLSKLIILFYLVLLTILCIYVDSTSQYFNMAMLLTTLITCRLISYSTIYSTYCVFTYEKFINFLSNICYEIYLVQYPVIFLFQDINVYGKLKLPIMIIIIFIVSIILHVCVNIKRKEKNKLIKYILRVFVLSLTVYGGYKYFIAEDHTAEMKALEKQLAENQSIIEQKQKEYELKAKQEQEDWMNMLQDLENSESELKNVVTNLSITGIGDSVMLGAVNNLYGTFPNGYFDAAVSRTAWVVNGIVINLRNRNILGDVVVFNLGANGDCSEDCKREIMTSCGDRKVFWINVTNDSDVYVNDDLARFASKYDNLYVIDWNSISKGHPEYFFADGIHLTDVGRVAYSNAIYDSIYQVYLDEFNEKKNEIINNHEANQKNKISFYGNDILLNVFDYIKEDYIDASFNINKNYDYETIKNDIKQAIQNNSLNYKIIFAFDNTILLDLLEYQELIELCSGHEIYILSTSEQSNNELSNINYENVKIINFYNEILNNNNYLIADRIHLSDEGNKALKEVLNSIINNSNEVIEIG